MAGGNPWGSAARFVAVLSLVAAGCAVETADPADPAVLEGELEVFAVRESAQTSVLHELQVDGGARFRLVFERKPQLLATGDRVRVTGSPLDHERFAVDELQLLGDETDGVAVTSQALIGNSVARTSRLAVLMVHWSQPNELTPDQMRERVFTGSRSTVEFYRENSYGLFELTGEVYGWYQISPMSGCDTQTLASRALAAARNDGVDVDAFDQILYYFPRTQACGWSGLASLGRPGRPARNTWYNGSSGCVVLAQELLHNFGALHSQSYGCGESVLASASQCQASEYGDPYDPMGGGCYHTNVYQKAAQGWFGRCNVVTTTADETFKLAPVEVASNVVQALRVPMDAALCPGELSSCYYYLEYRQPLGPFDGANPESPVHRGVLLHAAGAVDFSGGGRPGSPYLLDLTPNSSGRGDFLDAVLTRGETFEDPSGIRISVDALEVDGATVTVRFPDGGAGAPTCIDGTGIGVGPRPMQGMCEAGAYEFDNRCYAPTDLAATYDEAAALCAARGAGFRLAEIGSAAENDFVARVIGTGEFWLGATDLASEGVWVWDGSGTRFWSGGPTGAPEPGVYTNFETGEPNDAGGSDCLRMITGGAWRDINCGQEYPAVCESN